MNAGSGSTEKDKDPPTVMEAKLQSTPQSIQGKSSDSLNHNYDNVGNMDNYCDQLQHDAIDQVVCELNSTMQQCVNMTKDTVGSNELNPITIDPNTKHKDNLNGDDKPKDDPGNPQKQNTSIPHDLTKLTSNFEKHTPNIHQSKQLAKISKNPNQFPITKNGLVPELSPFTVVHTFATKLRANQARNEVPTEISPPTFTTRQGLPAVIFKRDDFLVKLASRCRYTLVGKFTNTMPKIELIRKSFILETQLTGGVKIAHFNARHIYIDLDNE